MARLEASVCPTAGNRLRSRASSDRPAAMSTAGRFDRGSPPWSEEFAGEVGADERRLGPSSTCQPRCRRHVVWYREEQAGRGQDRPRLDEFFETPSYR